MGGLALLAVGAATSWWAMSLGWAALAIAFFAWVAEAEGLLALPRPGRVAIRPGGGFDIPLAFNVRRGERVLFFVCEEDPERGGWSDVYTVLDRPKGTDGFGPCCALPPAPPPAGGRSVAVSRSTTCDSSTMSGAPTSRGDRSSARCAAAGV